MNVTVSFQANARQQSNEDPTQFGHCQLAHPEGAAIDWDRRSGRGGILAEGVRFELTREQSPLPVFKTGALNHSATLPCQYFRGLQKGPGEQMWTLPPICHPMGSKFGAMRTRNVLLVQ
jgi:hypothetical protein